MQVKCWWAVLWYIGQMLRGNMALMIRSLHVCKKQRMGSGIYSPGQGPEITLGIIWAYQLSVNFVQRRPFDLLPSVPSGWRMFWLLAWHWSYEYCGQVKLYRIASCWRKPSKKTIRKGSSRSWQSDRVKGILLEALNLQFLYPSIKQNCHSRLRYVRKNLQKLSSRHDSRCHLGLRVDVRRLTMIPLLPRSVIPEWVSMRTNDKIYLPVALKIENSDH